MNKGLAIHLISIVIHVLCVMYLYQENSPCKSERILIILCLIFWQLMTAALVSTTDYYKERR